VPRESIDKRAHRNKFRLNVICRYTASDIGNDLPSKEELFAGLGLNPGTAQNSDVETNRGELSSN